MLKLLTRNWETLVIGVLGGAAAVLGVYHDDKRKTAFEEGARKAYDKFDKEDEDEEIEED